MSFKRDLSFFTVDPENVNLDEVLSNINKLPRNNEKDGIIMGGNGYSIALSEFEENEDSCKGVVVRLRTQDIPVKGNLELNDYKLIELGTNEGLAEMTYFHYIKSLKVLCLLPAKNGVKWGTFTQYLQKKGDKDIELSVLLAPDALKLFRSFRTVTSVSAQVGVSHDKSSNSKAVKELPTGVVLDKDNLAGATRVVIKLYNPKRKGGLLAKVARTISEELRKLSGNANIQKLLVKGSQSPDIADQTIDLISQRYKISIYLKADGGRHLSFDECKEVVGKKIEENFEILESLVE